MREKKPYEKPCKHVKHMRMTSFALKPAAEQLKGCVIPSLFHFAVCCFPRFCVIYVVVVVAVLAMCLLHNLHNVDHFPKTEF